MNAFPKTLPEWKNDVARRLQRLRVDINSIMMNLPPIPDPEIGMPFTGPLSPVPFVFPAQTDQSGGTPGTAGTGGTSTVGGCPGATGMRTSYVVSNNGGCAYVGTYNDSKSFTTKTGNNCRWETGGIGGGLYGFGYNTATGVFTYFTDFATWTATVAPPNNGSSVVLSLTTDLTGGTCNIPGTITVTGQD